MAQTNSTVQQYTILNDCLRLDPPMQRLAVTRAVGSVKKCHPGKRVRNETPNTRLPLISCSCCLEATPLLAISTVPAHLARDEP